MTDHATVKPDAMNAAAVLLLQQFLDEIVSGDVVVIKIGGEDSEEDWTLSVSLMRQMPGTPKAEPRPPAPTKHLAACPMCKQRTFDVDEKVCCACEFADD